MQICTNAARTCFGHYTVGMIDDSLKLDAIIGSTMLLCLEGPLVDPHNKGLGIHPCHLDEGST